jgi:hypothetical protein
MFYIWLYANETPQAVDQLVGRETLTSSYDPSVLLLKPEMSALLRTFDTMGNKGQALFDQTVQSIRTSLQSGLSIVVVIGAGTMLLAFRSSLLSRRSQLMSRSTMKKPSNHLRSPAY